MRVFGWVLFGVGVLIVIIGLAMDTTVANDSAAALGAEFGTRTHNLGLLQNRELTVQIGLALLICGSVFATAPIMGASKDTPAEASVSVSPQAIVSSATDKPASELTLQDLSLLGIVRDGRQFVFGAHSFDSAADAVKFASANQWMRT